MTTDPDFWLRTHRRIAGLQPNVAAALLKTLGVIRDALSPAEIAHLIESGGADAVIREVITSALLDRAFIPTRTQIRTAVGGGFRYATADLPKGGKVDGAIAVSFDHLAPEVTAALRNLESAALDGLATTVRDAITQRVADGLALGESPAAIAKSLRDIVGMSPTQVENMAKYAARLNLESSDGMLAFHATSVRFAKFADAKIGTATDSGMLGRGFYFSTDPNIGRSNPVTLRVKLAFDNPLELSMSSWQEDKRALIRGALGLPSSASDADVAAELTKRGYDAVTLDYSAMGYKQKEIMVPKASQIRILKEGDTGLSAVDLKVAAYRRRAIAQHAETIARTTTLDAYKQGQALAWQTAVDSGITDGKVPMRRWVGVMDSRERESHIAMEGATARLGDPYSNGQDYPGQGEYNCRCIERFWIARG